MRDDIQDKIKTLWEKATTENLSEIGDLAGYKQDFLNLFGFGFEGVDYKAEANELGVIEKYLPKQMSREEIVVEVNILLGSVLELNKQKLIGMTMGAFVKKFPGLADPKLVREVIESIA